MSSVPSKKGAEVD
jgi:hypothetical protein